MEIQGLTEKQADAIADMQRRYEERINTQRDSIDRLVAVRNSLSAKVQELTKLLEDYGHGERRHLLKISEEGFALQHPLHERKDGKLLTCDLHSSLAATMRPPEPGLYWVSEAEDPIQDGLPNWKLEPYDG
jgi:16S rRNA C967 or C1407 C5-methylase (RsmB/RsmF family)